MLNKLGTWELFGFLFVVVFGTLLHFVYRWSGNNRAVGIFSPVNESTWEHLKLLFTPMLVFSIVEYFAVGQYFDSFIPAKTMGMILGLITIVALFYTYTGIIGTHYLWADILVFILGVAVAYGYSWTYIISHHTSSVQSNAAGLVLVGLLMICFAVFTFCAPHVALFLDPVSKEYGI